MQKYWDSQAAPVCVMQKTHGEEPSSWFISVIFQCMKKGLRPNGYFPLTRQPHFFIIGIFGNAARLEKLEISALLTFALTALHLYDDAGNDEQQAQQCVRIEGLFENQAGQNHGEKRSNVSEV